MVHDFTDKRRGNTSVASDWAERYQIGLDTLNEHGVLKP